MAGATTTPPSHPERLAPLRDRPVRDRPSPGATLRRPSRASVVVVVAVAVRLALLTAPLTSDEAGFLVVGSPWSPGRSLYGHYWVDRPPGIVAIFAVAHLLGGQVALRLIGALAAAGSVIAAAALGPALAPGRADAAPACAVLVAAMVSTPLLDVAEVDGEVLALPFLLLGLVLLLRAVPAAGGTRPGPWSGLARAAGAGVAAAAAVSVKQDMHGCWPSAWAGPGSCGPASPPDAWRSRCSPGRASASSGASYWFHYLVGLVPGLVLLLAACLGCTGAPGARVGISRRGLRRVLAPAVASTVLGLAFLAAHRAPGDTAVAAVGDPALLQQAGLSSPYPDLWSLPVRVHDPHLRAFTRLLRGPRHPEWLVVQGTSLASWGLDATTADRVAARHYGVVLTASDLEVLHRDA